MYKGTLFVIVALAPSLVCANTGVFEGSGHTIKLVRSEDIQLRSEEVTIVPSRGPFLFESGLSDAGRFNFDRGPTGLDRVEYRCKFVLRNRSKKRVTIQVGFPLTSSSLASQSRNLNDDDVTKLVLRYKFIVRDSAKTYHVRFAPYDETKKLESIFLWDMSFQGEEVRELNVAYELPMAMGLADTDTRKDERGKDDGKYAALREAVGESFGYVTVTGQSWAGPIERAKFEVYVDGFERYLRERWIVEGPEPTSAGHVMDEGELMVRKLGYSRWHIKARLIHRQVVCPDGWKEKDGVITWEFKNYRPQEPIWIAYTLTILPKTSESVPSFIRAVLGDKPTEKDLDDLREILMATWGITPKSQSVRRFVSNQCWYAPKEGMTAFQLTVEQWAVVLATARFFPSDASKAK